MCRCSAAFSADSSIFSNSMLTAQFYQSFEALQAGVPVVVVTGEGEIAVDAVGGDELLEERGGKLDVFTGGGADDDKARGAAIVIEALVRRDAEVKFKTLHGITFALANSQPATKASTGIACPGGYWRFV